MNLSSKKFKAIVPSPHPIDICHLDFQDGNVSLEEYFMIAQLIAHFSPMNLLELGTFDGNTTSLLAANAPPAAKVHTIDLPDAPFEPIMPLSKSDLKYILKDKKAKKFHDAPYHSKIIQHYGNTLTYDFSNFTQEKAVDFVFIDACHTYEYVKSDTEKTLDILSEGGIILWHDFTHIWPGVHQHLLELSQEFSLTHIEETTLVLYQSKK